MRLRRSIGAAPHSRPPQARIGRVPLTDLREGEQRDVSRALQRNRERSLMASARAGHPARQDLAPLREVPAQAGDLLVVDEVDVLEAEAAHLAAAAGEIRDGSPGPKGMYA